MNSSPKHIGPITAMLRRYLTEDQILDVLLEFNEKGRKMISCARLAAMLEQHKGWSRGLKTLDYLKILEKLKKEI